MIDLLTSRWHLVTLKVVNGIPAGIFWPIFTYCGNVSEDKINISPLYYANFSWSFRIWKENRRKALVSLLRALILWASWASQRELHGTYNGAITEQYLVNLQFEPQHVKALEKVA